MTIQGETRRLAFAPAGELVASACLALAGAAWAAAKAGAAIGRLVERRRVMAHLAGLDDHMLRDIGLTRSDLRDASASRLLDDPTRVLILRATERRAAARLIARARKRA